MTRRLIPPHRLYAHRLRQPILLALALVAGCRSGDPPSNTATNSGAQVAFTAGDPTKDLRLDAEAEDFVLVSSLGVGPQGQIIVFQPRDSRIIIYDSAGKRVADIGRKGEGPGEFAALAQQHGLVGDTIWAWDREQRRISLFSLSGELIGSYAPNYSTARGVRAPSADAPARAFTPYAVLSGRRTLAYSYVTPPGSVLLLSPAGEGVELFAVPADSGIVRAAPSRLVEVPFYSSPLWAAAQDGSMVALAESRFTRDGSGIVRLRLYAPASMSVRELSIPFVSAPIPRSAIDSALRALASGAQAEAQRQSLLGGEAARRVPPAMPLGTMLVVGLDHTIWFGSKGPRGPGRAEHWRVFDSTGKPLGEISLPPSVRLVQARATMIWGAVRREDGLDDVVRLRITLR